MDELSEDLELLPATRRALRHRIAVAQSEGRAPSVVAAVLRGGEVVWEGSRTSVEGHGPDGDVQYRIGSISKTFTAVLVMRLRDEGLLGLADPLEKHLRGTGVGEVTIAQLLAHTGGLAAETPGEWWERTPGELRPELVDVLGDEPLRHAPGSRHHYSNPGYTLLGSLVEALRGKPWEEVLEAEVLEPLGLERTSARPKAPHARRLGGASVGGRDDARAAGGPGADGSGRSAVVHDKGLGAVRGLPDARGRAGAGGGLRTGDAHVGSAPGAGLRRMRLRARDAADGPGRAAGWRGTADRCPGSSRGCG